MMRTTGAIGVGLFLVAAACLAADVPADGETALVAVLRSAAGPKEKADACRALGRTGTAAAVEALAPLLTDEALSHPARVALERIPDAAAGAALRAALERTAGRLREGIVGSLGERRDTNAVPALAALLAGADAGAAAASAAALGRIGTPEGLNVLIVALPGAPAALRGAIGEGLLRGAEAALARGDAATARIIYDRLRTSPVPPPVRCASLRGAILARGDNGLPLLLAALRGTNGVETTAALGVAYELAGAVATRQLAAAALELPPALRLPLVRVLAARGDSAAAPALLTLADAGQERPVRLAALTALLQVGAESALPLLVKLATDAEPEIAAAAVGALAAIPGPAADAAVLAMSREPAPVRRVAAADLLARRAPAGASARLLQLAADPAEEVRAASLRALRNTATVDDLPALLKMFKQAEGAASTALESTLAALCAREGRKAASADPACVQTLLAALPDATPAMRAALLRVAAAGGGPTALAALQAAAEGQEATTRGVARRLLCDWPTAAALPVLQKWARAEGDPAVKLLALRGALRLIPLSDAKPAGKLIALNELGPLVVRPEEQRLVLAALGEIPTTESLARVLRDLGTPGLKHEAAAAAVALGEQLAGTHRAEVAAAMKQVQTAVDDANLRKRAKKVLAGIKN